MYKDEIVEEVRRVRQAHAAAHGYDLKRIVEDIRRQEQESGRKFITLPPRPAVPRARAVGERPAR